MDIPIQNIYFLLCYAWNKLEERDIVSVEQVGHTKVVDLFTRVLNSGTSYLLRRGLDRGYELHEDQTSSIRGKVNFSDMLKENLLNQPRVKCVYDEFTHNVLHNQILKSTLRMLIDCEDVDNRLHEELIFIYRRLQGVDKIKIEKRHFRLVQLPRNNYFYDFLLKICELIIENLLISEEKGKSKFRDFVQDDRSMSILFEEFVRNFYKKEQSKFKVTRENIAWDAIPLDEISARVLPSMKTDISLISPSRKIVIDTKYYKEALQTHYNKQTIISGNLYQLYAYLRNLEPLGKENINCEGILLYPTVKSELHVQYDIKGHRVSVETINLNQDWKRIHEDLLKIIN